MSATADLLTQYQHVIGRVTLVTGDRGVFDVRIDGELVYSKHASGRHAEPGEVLALFRAVVGDDVPTYGARD